MKRLIKVTILLVLTLIVTYPLLWIAASKGLFGPVGFGYYGDYNIAKRAIQQTECVEAIEHELVHEDITLENFSFTVRTKPGWKLALTFIYEMNVRRVCERPRGVLFYNPGRGMQVYTLEYLSDVLKDKNIKLQNLPDILCNLDELVSVFRANYENDQILCIADEREGFLDYLWIDTGPWKFTTSRSFAVSEPKFTETMERFKSGGKPLPLRRIEFDVVTTDSNGAVKDLRKQNSLYYAEELGDGVALEMVKIPGGKFLMGTSEAEAAKIAEEFKRYSGDSLRNHTLDFLTGLQHEIPQHEVTVPEFFMGRFEITQTQWRVVSRLPKVNIDLRSDPSQFKGDDLPVESISWDEAIEFCNRLSRATGREYRLPSEAEWEYACRAGTTSLYNFGDVITTELANYEGIYPYGSSLWGLSRETTTPVGSFGTPNALGLYDMHGNVHEMCLDVWHGNYQGAPSDGSAWTAGKDDSIHVVRGGGLFSNPRHIRTARRGQDYEPSIASYKGGLRVVATTRKK